MIYAKIILLLLGLVEKFFQHLEQQKLISEGERTVHDEITNTVKQAIDVRMSVDANVNNLDDSWLQPSKRDRTKDR